MHKDIYSITTSSVGFQNVFHGTLSMSEVNSRSLHCFKQVSSVLCSASSKLFSSLFFEIESLYLAHAALIS
jgi:hypothetical protein